MRMSETIVDSAVIQLTQTTLGKYVKKPMLTDKLLSKPPFRFLFDVFKAVIRETGYFENLYTADELNYENIKDRDDKKRFLQKMIDVVKLTTNVPLEVRTSKIVAGYEADKTNELLQNIGLIIEKQLEWQTAVQQVITGHKPTPEGRNAAQASRKSKKLEATTEKVKSTSSKIDPKTLKQAMKQKQHKQQHQQQQQIVKSHPAEKKNVEKVDKTATKKTTSSSSITRPSQTKSKVPKDSKHRQKNIDITDKLPAKEDPTLNHKNHNKQQDPAKQAKEVRKDTETANKSVMDAMNTKKEVTIKQKSNEPAINVKSEAVLPSRQLLTMKEQAQMVNPVEQNTDNKLPIEFKDSKNEEEVKSFENHPIDAIAISAINQLENNTEQEISENKTQSENNSIQITSQPVLLHEPQQDSKSKSQVISINTNEADLQPVDSNQEIKKPFEQRSSKTSISPESTIEINTIPIDPQNTSTNLQIESIKPVSAQTSTNMEVKRQSTFTKEEGTDKTEVRPRTSLRPPSARPPSARPGAPRRRDRNIEIILHPNEQVNGAAVDIKLDVFQDIGDSDNLVIVDNSNDYPEDNLNSGDQNDDNKINANAMEQGHLVQQILETQRELIHSPDTGDNYKNEKEVSNNLVLTQTSTQHIHGLRDIIEDLTKIIHPLGKLLEFIPEDIDAMQLEFNMWRDSYTQTSHDLKRERSLIESSTEPLKQQLNEIEVNIREYQEMIDTIRANILKSSDRIYKLLNK